MREKLRIFIQTHFGHVFLAFIAYLFVVVLFLSVLSFLMPDDGINGFADKYGISLNSDVKDIETVKPHLREVKLAIVIRGLGLSEEHTKKAITSLPAGISLAFSAYSKKIKHWTSEARRFDHSVLLEVPMEPLEYPENDPGDLTLLTRHSDLRNIELLKSSLKKAHGIKGVITRMGEGFMKSGGHLSPVFEHLKKNNLYLLDTVNYGDLKNMDTDVKKIASDNFLTYKKPEFILDEVATKEAIKSKLKMMEETARLGSGYAIAVADAYPVTIDVLKDWNTGLEDRNVKLVPVGLILEAIK